MELKLQEQGHGESRLLSPTRHPPSTLSPASLACHPLQDVSPPHTTSANGKASYRNVALMVMASDKGCHRLPKLDFVRVTLGDLAHLIGQTIQKDNFTPKE